MKQKKLIGLFGLAIILLFSCNKENDFLSDKTNTNGAKLKRILLYSTVDSEEPISIIEEYEYDSEGRISKVSSPMYENGEIVGTIKYDLYEYNQQGHLAEINNFNANINASSGFINLKNYIYTYSANGRKEKEKIEYPQIGSFEYSLYKYTGDKLRKIENYDNSGNLESYVINDYDNSGNIIRETSFTGEGQPISYTQNTYVDGLNIKSDVFVGEDLKDNIREILNTYDKNKNLIMKESNELLMYSSMMSYVLKYEYFEE